MDSLAEVLNQLKFLTLKTPASGQMKLKGADWTPVRSRDIESPPKAQEKPTDWKKTPSKTPTLGGSGALDKSADDKWKKPEKWFSAGGVVVASKDDYSKIYIRKPSNNFGPWSFPKGRIDKGESPPKTALREVEEEIGVKAALVPGGYLGTGDGGYSITHYYLMYAVTDTGRHDKETEKVELLPWSEAIHTFARAGNLRDLRITTRALDMVERMRKAGKIP